LPLLPERGLRGRRTLPALRELPLPRGRPRPAPLVVPARRPGLPGRRRGLGPASLVSTMADPLITLTTDFGTDSPYVAAMKGVILGINPAARLIDLSHDIPPQDLRHTAFFLTQAVPYFPPGTLHVVVVDPGVGSDRAALCVCLHGQRLLVPDNGC